MAWFLHYDNQHSLARQRAKESLPNAISYVMMEWQGEESMQEIVLPVTGLCPECSVDLSGEISLWAPPSWLNRYETDLRLRRGIDRSVVRLVLDQHKRQCAGRAARHKLITQPA